VSLPQEQEILLSLYWRLTTSIFLHKLHSYNLQEGFEGYIKYNKDSDHVLDYVGFDQDFVQKQGPLAT
jgi:hypothetical protein